MQLKKRHFLLSLAGLLALVAAPIGAATFIQDVQIKTTANSAILGVPVGTQLNTALSQINTSVDQPGRLSATSPTADALLHIRAFQTPTGDGSSRSLAATSSLVPLRTSDTTINFQTASTAGATVLTDGSTFGLPTSTPGDCRRMVMVVQKDGTINTHFGADIAAGSCPTNLENPGTLLGSLNGDPIGWIDLTATGSNAYKTIGSATSIVENATSSTSRIVSFGSGGGGGGGGGGSFVLWHPIDGNAPLKVEENSEETYQFSSGLGQQLRGTLKVPTSYIAGNPIKVKLAEYSPDTTGTVLLSCTSNLIRASAPDAVSSTTNSRTSTNTVVTLGSPASAYHEVVCDVSSATGTINSVAVSPGDILSIYVTRGSDTGASDLRMIPSATEVTFQ